MKTSKSTVSYRIQTNPANIAIDHHGDLNDALDLAHQMNLKHLRDVEILEVIEGREPRIIAGVCEATTYLDRDFIDDITEMARATKRFNVVQLCARAKRGDRGAMTILVREWLPQKPVEQRITRRVP